MCYLKFHKCKFCSTEYACSLPNYVCPSINADREADMCKDCLKELEERIQKYNFDVALITLEEIMEYEG